MFFKQVNWQKIEKSFGFGSVEFSKVSAKTETSPKLLISARTETETEISVVHYLHQTFQTVQTLKSLQTLQYVKSL